MARLRRRLKDRWFQKAPLVGLHHRCWCFSLSATPGLKNTQTARLLDYLILIRTLLLVLGVQGDAHRNVLPRGQIARKQNRHFAYSRNSRN